MLGKLLKYEFKSTGRLFMPLFGALLIFALVVGILQKVGDANWLAGIPFAVSSTLYACLMVAMFVLTFVVMVQRFYKNLLTDEGYLMFTLPVKPWQHITCKTVVSTVWILLSLLVMCLSLLLVMLPEGQMFASFFNELGYLYQEFILDFGFSPIPVALEVILVLLMGIISSVIGIYAAIAIGQLSNKHKLLASFAAYLVINTVLQILYMVGLQIFDVAGFLDWASLQSNLTLWHTGVLGLGFSCIVETAILFIITNLLIKKKLNLE